MKTDCVEFFLPEPRLQALRAAVRRLQRLLGDEAPSLEQLIAYQLSNRDARLIASDFIACRRAGG